jgi:hypothetical protein
VLDSYGNNLIPNLKEINKYSGEPLIYLDHNVLDKLHKGKLPDFLLSLKASDFQVVYSDETLNEIRRSGEKSPVYSNQFLQLLNDLNAAHIKIRLNQDFSPTEELMVNTISPFDVYSQHCNGEQIYEDLLASMMLLPFKINGGGVGVSFDDIKREQLRVFDELLEYLDSLANDIEDESPSAAELIRAQRKTSMQQLTEMLDDTFRQLRENVKNEENWSGLNEFRNAIKLEPYHFNTVQKPHALQQVWEKVKLADSIAENNFTLEEFFGLLKNPIYPERPYFDHEKVTAIYTYLNMIGYYPDKPLHTDRGFVRANSDLRHASIASLTHFLVSSDERFVKKVEAAYEFLGIQTEVLYLQP